MIVILRQGSTKSDAQPILTLIEQAGLKPLYLPGEEKIVLGAIGDERKLAELHLESLPCVERVVPILKPYKLTNREFKKSSTLVNVGNVVLGARTIVHIAGPCAVESEEQIITAAKAVKKAGAHILRGGAYKPRTSPYAFQGLEKQGLELLALARTEVGLPIVTEVTSELDVDLVASYADMLQVGARNMQNFRLLKALGTLRKPILLKRGLVASIPDLLMAAEYIYSDGNDQIVLCERGIKSFFPETRNTLDLAAVPLLKRESHLPVIVDPSHGTGVKDIITPMACAAVAAGADGLLIEVHPNPACALSDGFQQLSPSEYEELVNRVSSLEDVCRSFYSPQT